jgi:hypothetical protein
MTGFISGWYAIEPEQMQQNKGHKINNIAENWGVGVGPLVSLEHGYGAFGDRSSSGVTVLSTALRPDLGHGAGFDGWGGAGR